MLTTFQIAALLLIALAVAASVGHALELPGKMRLDRAAYLSVQTIYYPGFTIVGGFGEMLGLLAALALLFVTPRTSSAFWLTMGAFAAMALLHAIFWIFTQPVNRFWLREQQLSGAARAFFGTGRNDSPPPSGDWKRMRNKWEYSHLARAVLSMTALALLASAIAES